MNQNDYHAEAVRTWQRVNGDLKHFSDCCYHVENKIDLAADCKCNVRTIQFYAAAWSLYQELLGEYETKPVSLMWERGEIALWRKAPELRNRLDLSLDKTYEYLEVAIEGNMTRESFAAHVDNKENHTPKWIRRLQSAIRFLKPSKDDYKSEMPPEAQARYERAVTVFVSELEAIAQEGVTE